MSEWSPPDWLVEAMTDAFLGGDYPAFVGADEVRESGVLQAMHDLGVQFSQVPLIARPEDGGS